MTKYTNLRIWLGYATLTTSKSLIRFTLDRKCSNGLNRKNTWRRRKRQAMLH